MLILIFFTVVPGVSSHNYDFKMYGPRVLEWTFNNILLPDSNVDEPNSHGFITFSVDQVPNLVNGSIINNDVGIYFDYNSPVITNTTLHTINDNFQINLVGIDELILSDDNIINIYPNPSNGVIYIELDGASKNKIFYVYDAVGKKILSGILNQHINKINVSSFNSGLYFIQIGKDNLPVKFIKK